MSQTPLSKNAAILEGLKNLQNKTSIGTYDYSVATGGICRYINRYLGRHYENAYYAYSSRLDFHPLYEAWEHFSGNVHFPVPHAIGNPAKGFTLEVFKWGDNDYGNLRRNLLQYLIDCFERKVADETET